MNTERITFCGESKCELCRRTFIGLPWSGGVEAVKMLVFCSLSCLASWARQGVIECDATCAPMDRSPL